MTVGLGLYFLPTIVAVVAQRRNAPMVAIVNTLLGWSFVGWIVALVMAAARDPEPHVIYVDRTAPYAPITYEDATYRKIPGTKIQPR